MTNFMGRAIELAKYAASLGEVPVGAVIVEHISEKIVGEGYNRCEMDGTALAHAELIAIKQATNTLQASMFKPNTLPATNVLLKNTLPEHNLKNWRLDSCDIYVTLEPCIMCTGGIINSRIRRVYFGAYDTKSYNSGICNNFSPSELFELPNIHKPECYGGILEEKCRELLTAFFYTRPSR